jgi:hypothetical protein
MTTTIHQDIIAAREAFKAARAEWDRVSSKPKARRKEIEAADLALQFAGGRLTMMTINNPANPYYGQF